MTGVRLLVLRALARNALASVPMIHDTRSHPRYQRGWESLVRAIMG